VSPTPASGRNSAARPKPRVQVAALPFRLDPGPNAGLQILLVTSRETGRWVIPKGWPMKAKSNRVAAAVEALEEAGVEGRIAKKALGAYKYLKVLRSGDVRPCRVSVFPLEVTAQRDAWREQDQRSTQWFAWEAAADAVNEPGLKRLIRKFAKPFARDVRAGEEAPAPAGDPSAESGEISDA
jgi:8-oxo-dGTP pyrophosphatase MutT (NUDIX family)